MLAVFLLAVACNPQAKLMKQARLQSQAGKYEDAANLYYNVLLAGDKSKESRAGLQLNGQKVLADKFAKFSKLVIENRIEEALKIYAYAQGYAANSGKVGVMLEWPHEYDEVYEDIRQEYTQTQYDVAIELIRNRKYEQAEKVFERIAQYDTSYRQVSVLRLNTVLEPLYNKGMNQYRSGQFKEAYYSFNKIAQIDDQYKDALKMRSQSQQQATSLVGILPVYYHVAAQGLQKHETDLSGKIADILSRQQGAYVRITNTGLLEKDLANRGFIHIDTREKALEAGKNMDLAYVTLVVADSFWYHKTPSQIYEREAFEAVTDNILNPYTKTYSSISKFKKASYTDKTEGQYVYAAFHYLVIDVRSGALIISDTLSVSRRDELHAATYGGDPANLYPSLPEGNYLPHVPDEWRQMFRNPRKNLLPVNRLVDDTIEEVTEKITRRVQQNL